MPLGRLSLPTSNAEKIREFTRSIEMKNFNNNVYKFNNQDYWQIKRQCRDENRLFSDNTFNNEDSIKNINELDGYQIEWRRPIHIISNPQFKINASRGVVQGILGNCWLVAAFSSLVSQPKLWNKVVPFVQKQNFSIDDYTGVFVFRFWRFGFWIEVVVDDLLPTIGNKLAFAHSDYENEFWCALLEKAYAKINNGYSNLEGGHVEALIHFSGGVPEYIEMKNKEYTKSHIDALWQKIVDANDSQSLMTACIEAESNEDIEKELLNGLLMGHSYSVTGIRSVYIENKEQRLIRLANPWRKKEWNGNWSKRSSIWRLVTKKQMKKMECTTKENGEFWISFIDFYNEFSEIVICHNLNKCWKSFKESSVYGYWRKPDRCGGCINYKTESFLANPQYRFDICKPNGDEIVICLTQRNKRSDWKRGLKNLHIGFYIIPIEFNRTLRLSTIENEMRSLDTPLQNSESVMLRTKLSYGRYCIIPHTFDRLQEGEFLLRIFTHKYCHLRELESSIRFSLNRFLITPPQCVTQIVIKNGLNLKYFMYPSFIMISCEGQVIKSNVIAAQKNPQWDVSAIFYRRNYHVNPITVSLYAIKTMGIITHEKYVGSVFLTGEPNDSTFEFLATVSNTMSKKNLAEKLKRNLVCGLVRSMRDPYVL